MKTIHSVSAGSHTELLENIRELNLTKEQIVQIVPFDGLLVAYYYA